MQYFEVNTEPTIEELLERYRDISAEIAPAINALNALEKRIKAKVLELNKDIEVDGAKATIRAGYTRYSWNSKALEGYAVAHPDIVTLRQESQVKPSVSIKLD